ncbi:MAG: hypothetical protein ACFFB3_09605 [Candidatus Hodarchaeota archaeon]
MNGKRGKVACPLLTIVILVGLHKQITVLNAETIVGGTFQIQLDTAELVGLQKEITASSAETIAIEIRGILLDIVLPVGLPKEDIVLNVVKFCKSIDRIGRILTVPFIIVVC